MHVQAIEQIAAKRARVHRGLEVGIGRGDEPHVDGAHVVLADAAHFARFERAQQLGLHPRRHRPDLVEKQRPARGVLDQARAGRGRAGKGAAGVAEELVFEKRVGQRGAVQRDEGFVGARAARMHRARDELLARAGLSRDQDRARRGRRAADQIFHAPHRLALADERVDRAAGLDLTLQQIDLARQPAALRRGADAHEELVAEERLLHEVDGAEFHRLDRRVDGAEPGHHDEGGVDVKRAQPLEHDEAGDPRHPHVRQDDVEDVALRGRDAFLAGRCRLYGEAGAAQHARHAVANALIVVDDKDAGHAA